MIFLSTKRPNLYSPHIALWMADLNFTTYLAKTRPYSCRQWKYNSYFWPSTLCSNPPFQMFLHWTVSFSSSGIWEPLPGYFGIYHIKESMTKWEYYPSQLTSRRGERVICRNPKGISDKAPVLQTLLAEVETSPGFCWESQIKILKMGFANASFYWILNSFIHFSAKHLLHAYLCYTWLCLIFKLLISSKNILYMYMYIHINITYIYIVIFYSLELVWWMQINKQTY